MSLDIFRLSSLGYWNNISVKQATKLLLQYPDEKNYILRNSSKDNGKLVITIKIDRKRLISLYIRTAGDNYSLDSDLETIPHFRSLDKFIEFYKKHGMPFDNNKLVFLLNPVVKKTSIL